MTSAPAIGFEYRPSMGLRRLRGLVAIAALVAIGFCGAGPWVRCGLVVVAATLLLIVVHRAPQPPSAVGWSDRGGWTLRMADGRDLPARLVSSRVWAGFVVLCLVGDRKRHALWLLPDNSDADTRRRVRMRLAVLATHGEHDAA